MTAVPPGLLTSLQDRYGLDHEIGQGGMATACLAQVPDPPVREDGDEMRAWNGAVFRAPYRFSASATD